MLHTDPRRISGQFSGLCTVKDHFACISCLVKEKEKKNQLSIDHHNDNNLLNKLLKVHSYL